MILVRKQNNCSEVECRIKKRKGLKSWTPLLLISSSDGKESACNAGDLGLIPGSGRSPGKGKGYPLQCSGLENSTDRGAWCGLPSMGSQSRTEWLMLSEEAKPQGAPPLATVGIQASLFSEHFFLFPCPLSTQCPSNPHVTLNAEASWKINQ